MHDELFDALACHSGKLEAVFEYDSGAAYFYLCEVEQDAEPKIIDRIHVWTGASQVTKADIWIRWTRDDERVGLYLFGELWAVFNLKTGQKFGGDFNAHDRPAIPPEQRI